MTRGFLIAADSHCEWLIPWFYQRLRAVSQLPLAVVDMGLSRGAHAFCKERSTLLPLDLSEVPQFDPQTAGWYKKPFAFLQTPFDKTLWLDCDCEVVRPIDHLFDLEGELYLVPDTENSHRKERHLGTIKPGETLYNSGVILYDKEAPLIQKWAEAGARDEAFFSDQHVLSSLIHSSSSNVRVLPCEYNWRMSQGLNIHAAIIHWAGSWGKAYIRQRGGLAHELTALPQL